MLASLTVNSLLDNETPGDGLVTLREAVAAANADAETDLGDIGSGADTIQFDAALSGAVELSTVGDATAGPSALLIDSPMTIVGNSSGITIQRSGAAEMRLIRVATGASLTLDRITLTGGVVRAAAGLPGENGDDARGGAIFNEGTLELLASTLFDNKAIGGAPGDGGISGAGMGGAVFNSGGTVDIRNSTFSSNSALNSSESPANRSFGGGIYSLNGTLHISNSTLMSGAATTGRGVYVFAAGGGTSAVHVNSSIIAQSGGPYLTPDLAAIQDTESDTIVTSGSNNLIRRAVNFSGTWDEDPLLQALDHNGGPTRTHALQAVSPAINSGSNALNLSSDQRGAAFARVVGGAADIGAFEQQQVPPELVGDYNRDTVVDVADFVMWRKLSGIDAEPYSGADGNGDTHVDDEDYGLWAENFSEVLPAALGAGHGGGVAAAGSPQSIPLEVRPAAAPATKQKQAARAITTLPFWAHEDALLAALALNPVADAQFADAEPDVFRDDRVTPRPASEATELSPSELAAVGEKWNW
jgi:hypothetical protein